jgi:hypothetical protein
VAERRLEERRQAPLDRVGIGLERGSGTGDLDAVLAEPSRRGLRKLERVRLARRRLVQVRLDPRRERQLGD